MSTVQSKSTQPRASHGPTGRWRAASKLGLTLILGLGMACQERPSDAAATVALGGTQHVRRAPSLFESGALLSALQATEAQTGKNCRALSTRGVRVSPGACSARSWHAVTEVSGSMENGS